MIDNDVFVIDAVAHSYDLRPGNIIGGPAITATMNAQYDYGHLVFSPKGRPEWLMDRDLYFGGGNPELAAHAFFAESWTDYVVYHEVKMQEWFAGGVSPLWVGQKMRELAPARVSTYGFVSPFRPGAVDEVDRLVEEEGCLSIKLYPAEMVDGAYRGFRMDDPELAFPVLERCQQRGIKMVGIHKAVPFGPYPYEPYKPFDIQGAALAFPDLLFEVVHGGFAYLEDTAMLLGVFSNIIINLEGTSLYACNKPRKFAEIMGTFLANGGADRIVWSVGATAVHPQPYLEAFWNMQIPEDLVEGYEFPQITREMKKKILGENYARIWGWDIEEMKRAVVGDSYAGDGTLAAPWSGVQAAAKAG